MMDDIIQELKTSYGDKYSMQVISDGRYHWIIIVCNGAIVAQIANAIIPKKKQNDE